MDDQVQPEEELQPEEQIAEAPAQEQEAPEAPAAPEAQPEEAAEAQEPEAPAEEAPEAAKEAPDLPDGQPAEGSVKLSDSAVSALGLSSNQAELVSKGEVESVVKVDDAHHVVGNEEIS